jgi:hypothetical protein
VHGTGFEFFRNEALNARNFFAPTGTKPAFRRNQFGGVLGGPVIRDRTFFFVDYQGQRQNIDRTVISTVPTALQRDGIFTEAIGGAAVFDLRPRDDDGCGRYHDASSFPWRHYSDRADGSDRTRAARPLPDAHQPEDSQQLPSHRQRVGRRWAVISGGSA